MRTGLAASVCGDKFLAADDAFARHVFSALAFRFMILALEFNLARSLAGVRAADPAAIARRKRRAAFRANSVVDH